MQNLYSCSYAQFFVALATLEQTHLLPSRLLAPHARYYVREMRVKAYSQLLESYRSLTVDGLSAAFGVSTEFVDTWVLLISLSPISY
jgi:26S proteasome regulatory subunit N7